jgi:hypothetical protein
MNNVHLSMNLRKANEKLGEQKVKLGELTKYNGELVAEQVVNKILWEERIAELELERDIANNKLIDSAVKIAELQEERNVLTAFIIKRMPPIKAMSSTYKICKIISDEVDIILKAHNLEQQAKGVEDLNRDETSVGRLHNGDKRSFIFSQDAWLRAFDLRNQAKALKE